MVLATDKITISKGENTIELTVLDLQKVMMKQGYWVDVNDLSEIYKEKYDEIQKYKDYIGFSERLIEFIDDNTDEPV